MRVVIEAQPLLRARTGVGEYTFQLIDHMVPYLKDRGIELSLFYFNFLKRNQAIPKWNNSLKVREQIFLPGRCFSYLWKKSAFPPLDWLTGKVDLFHFPNFIARPLTQGKTVATIHDLSFLRYPEYAEEKNLTFLRKWIPYTLEKASKILVVSEFTKRELIDLYPINEHKVVVAPNGVSPLFAPITDLTLQEKVSQKYRLPSQFMLAVGTLEPRKNLMVVLKALSLLKRNNKEVYPLVLIGPPGWNQEYERLKAFVEQEGLSEKVQFLFYVDREDMPALYSMSRFLVFPSLYEGFGLPVLEVMACGRPALVSNVASLPEVGGDAVKYCTADQPDEWAERIPLFWDESGDCESRIKRGFTQVQNFTWKRSAEITLDTYLEVLNG